MSPDTQNTAVIIQSTCAEQFSDVGEAKKQNSSRPSIQDAACLYHLRAAERRLRMTRSNLKQRMRETGGRRDGIGAKGHTHRSLGGFLEANLAAVSLTSATTSLNAIRVASTPFTSSSSSPA